MQLEGSCHCGRVRFRLQSAHPYPFNLCYCSICRKTATFEVEGREHATCYQPHIPDPDTGELKQNPGQRYFCKHCGSALWAWDPRWPELVHPFASAIDGDLPVPPERTHMMLGSKAPWVEVCAGPRDQQFDAYPEQSLAEWHQRLGLEDNAG